MNELYIILLILLVHWIGDFVLQTQKQAENKAESKYYLTLHVFNYTLFLYTLVLVFLYNYNIINYGLIILWPIVNGILHWITDYFTSKINRKLWQNGKVHNFFVSVGFDQLLHYITLLLTFKLMILNY